MRIEVTRTIPGPYPYSKDDVRIVLDDSGPDGIEQARRLLDDYAPFQAQGRKELPREDPSSAPPRPSGAQRKRLQDLAALIEEHSGEPTRFSPPRTAEEADELIKDMETAVKDFQAPTEAKKSTWSGHDSKEWEQGREVIAKKRRCQSEACTVKGGRAIEIRVWDYSVQNFGRPLCRTCQDRERGRS